ncbi:uncharacterized protein LOC129906724 [Episyrphus balteatus]|uniref:uncharacterized protein LOC129906724 n=1 Tax=Episyrphus balteatus TaxID=286459 RepID=UPI0024866E92|nr:uncharacterized protein LOC129906724 [Episyrphus balteatus]
MSNVKPVCVFCGSKKDKIILFNQERLDKCLGILKIRQANNLVGYKVKLNPLNKSEGYHSKCLNNFTALKAKYKQCYVKSELNLPGHSAAVVIRENIEVNEVSEQTLEEPEKSICDSSIAASEHNCVGLAEQDNKSVESSEERAQEKEIELKKCIFCKLERKIYKGRISNLHTCTKEDSIDKIKAKAVELKDSNLMMEIDNRLLQRQPILYHTICFVRANDRLRTIKNAQKRKYAK